MIIIKKVIFENYRNFTRLEVDLSHFSCIIGKNGIGKTKILQGIPLLQANHLEESSKNINTPISDKQYLIFDINLDQNLILHKELYGMRFAFIEGIYGIELSQNLRSIRNCPISISLLENKTDISIRYNPYQEIVKILKDYSEKHAESELTTSIIKSFSQSSVFSFLKTIHSYRELKELETIIDYLKKQQFINAHFAVRVQSDKEPKNKDETFNGITDKLDPLVFKYLQDEIFIRFISKETPNFIVLDNFEIAIPLEHKIISNFFKQQNRNLKEIDNLDLKIWINIFKDLGDQFTQEIQKYDYIWDDTIIDFYVRQNQMHREIILTFKKPNNRELYFKDLSSGQQWLLILILEIYDLLQDPTKKGIFLIDEPALNLHPGAQMKVMKFLRSLAERAQVIYTTHHVFLMDFEDLDSLILLDQDEHGQPFQNKDRIEFYKNLYSVLDIPANHVLFNRQKYIICEGDSDQILFQAIAKQMMNARISLAIEDISQITHQKGAPNSTHLAFTFDQIQFKKFVIILDSDPAGRKGFQQFKEKNLADKVIILTKKNAQGEDINDLAIEDFIPPDLFQKGIETYFEGDENLPTYLSTFTQMKQSNSEQTQRKFVETLLKSQNLRSKVEFMKVICGFISQSNFNQFGEIVDTISRASNIILL